MARKILRPRMDCACRRRDNWASSPRGSGGFGYDPIFVPEGETGTVGELGDAWKNEHSHRARSARALREALERFLLAGE